MGYKRIIRSIVAESNRSHRASMQYYRQLEREAKAQARMEEAEQAAFEVKQYENHIERMITVHKECSDSVDWDSIIRRKAPEKPVNLHTNEIQARQALSSFKPTIFNKMIGSTEKRKAKLELEIQKAIEIDARDFIKDIELYNEDLSEYIRQLELAKNITSGNIEYYIEAIREFDPVSEISELGSRVEFLVINKHLIKSTIYSHGPDIIPKKVKTLLKTGKLSEKDMPIGRFNELYQDYVCSASIRVARELFALLPVDAVVVNSVSKMLNNSNGTIEDQIILSVKFIRSTMSTINFESIDPSDCMSNFVHSMGFKKTQGMRAVTEVAL